MFVICWQHSQPTLKTPRKSKEEMRERCNVAPKCIAFPVELGSSACSHKDRSRTGMFKFIQNRNTSKHQYGSTANWNRSFYCQSGNHPNWWSLQTLIRFGHAWTCSNPLRGVIKHHPGVTGFLGVAGRVALSPQWTMTSCPGAGLKFWQQNGLLFA